MLKDYFWAGYMVKQEIFHNLAAQKLFLFMAYINDIYLVTINKAISYKNSEGLY